MSSLGLPADLPHEVVSVLPADPFAQLDLSHRIANYALSQKISSLESEGNQLKETLIQKQTHIKSLERKASNLEVELQDTQIKNKQIIEDNHRLQNERTALIDLVKKLNKEVSKLESFKKSLYQQLQDDAESVAHIESSTAALEISSERLLSEALTGAVRPATITSSAYNKSSNGLNSLMGGNGRMNSSNGSIYSPPRVPHPSYVEASPMNVHHHHQHSIPSHLPSYQQPPPPPQQHSYPSQPLPNYAPQSPRNISAPPQTPPPSSMLQQHQQPPPPPQQQQQQQQHPLYQQQQQPHHQQQQQQQQQYSYGNSVGENNAATPSDTSSPQIDGREFFRLARSRLSYEMFSQFLLGIKELNAGKMSREEALRKARDIFGSANADLYGMFETLLSRHSSI